MLNYDDRYDDPEAVECPNPKCDHGQVWDEAKAQTGWCEVCDGAPTIYASSNDGKMWDAIDWAEKRGLPIEYAEPMSREDYLDEYGPDR